MYNISTNIRDGAISQKINIVPFCLYILYLNGHQHCIILWKVTEIFVDLVLGFFHLLELWKSQPYFGKSPDFYQMVSDTRQRDRDINWPVWHTESVWWFSSQWQNKRVPNTCVRDILFLLRIQITQRIRGYFYGFKYKNDFYEIISFLLLYFRGSLQFQELVVIDFSNLSQIDLVSIYVCKLL